MSHAHVPHGGLHHTRMWSLLPRVHRSSGTHHTLRLFSHRSSLLIGRRSLGLRHRWGGNCSTLGVVTSILGIIWSVVTVVSVHTITLASTFRYQTRPVGSKGLEIFFFSGFSFLFVDIFMFGIQCIPHRCDDLGYFSKTCIRILALYGSLSISEKQCISRNWFLWLVGIPLFLLFLHLGFLLCLCYRLIGWLRRRSLHWVHHGRVGGAVVAVIAGGVFLTRSSGRTVTPTLRVLR